MLVRTASSDFVGRCRRRHRRPRRHCEQHGGGAEIAAPPTVGPRRVSRRRPRRRTPRRQRPRWTATTTARDRRRDCVHADLGPQRHTPRPAPHRQHGSTEANRVALEGQRHGQQRQADRGRSAPEVATSTASATPRRPPEHAPPHRTVHGEAAGGDRRGGSDSGDASGAARTTPAPQQHPEVHEGQRRHLDPSGRPHAGCCTSGGYWPAGSARSAQYPTSGVHGMVLRPWPSDQCDLAATSDPDQARLSQTRSSRTWSAAEGGDGSRAAAALAHQQRYGRDGTHIQNSPQNLSRRRSVGHRASATAAASVSPGRSATATTPTVSAPGLGRHVGRRAKVRVGGGGRPWPIADHVIMRAALAHEEGLAGDENVLRPGVESSRRWRRHAVRTTVHAEPNTVLATTRRTQPTRSGAPTPRRARDRPPRQTGPTKRCHRPTPTAARRQPVYSNARTSGNAASTITATIVDRRDSGRSRPSPRRPSAS